MRNQFRFDDKRNESNMLKDFLEKKRCGRDRRGHVSGTTGGGDRL